MCSAFTLKSADHYFARNLDLEYNYHEEVCITPRNYPFSFCFNDCLERHYALIGMAYVMDDYPLYYDACNEKGVSMAGLSMTYHTHYKNDSNKKHQVAVYEFIPWVLGQCKNISEVKKLLENTALVAVPFHDKLPASPLHFIINDEKESIVVECVKEGMKIYDDKVGVLTNNPPFPMMLQHLNNYLYVSNKQGENRFSNEIDFPIFSNGMGGLGLPGDFTSPSRFVRTVFLKYNSKHKNSEESSVVQCFRILDQVSMVHGSVHIKEDLYEKTIYSSVINTTKQIYYFKTYENINISCICLHQEDLDKKDLISYLIRDKFEAKCKNLKNA